MDTNQNPTALEELAEFVRLDREQNGLIEMTFCPGSDREVASEDAAKVALAMLRYEP